MGVYALSPIGRMFLGFQFDLVEEFGGKHCSSFIQIIVFFASLDRRSSEVPKAAASSNAILG